MGQNTDLDSTNDGGNDGNTPAWLTEIRRKADLYDKEYAPLQRKVALIDAGVDMSNPVATLFQDAYKGELTAEAIKAEAAKYGLVKAPAATQDAPGTPDIGEQVPQPSDPALIAAQQAAAMQRIDAAAQGGQDPTAAPPPWQTAPTAEAFMAQYAAANPDKVASE